jgi:hypothetical protein
MEVHPPHKPILSVKEFLVHLLAITIGLLIALGLEASVEGIHHRRLVREARENILQEIRDNERNVAGELNALPTEKSYLRKTLDTVSEPPSRQHTEFKEDFTWTFTRLNASGWEAALSTGAVAHMSYQEAKRYSELYALQRLFNENMERYVQKRGEMYALLSLTREPSKPTPDLELEAGKRSIAEEMVIGDFLREIGQTLAEQYRSMGQQNEFVR